jgi:hypothetical protein
MFPYALAANELDERDQQIFEEIRVKWMSVPGIRVGDFALWPNGHLRRICYDLGDRFQTTKGGSFYTTGSDTSYSGTLQPAVPADFFVQTNEMRDGEFWFFSHRIAGAGRGKYIMLPCRVYRLEPRAIPYEEAVRRPRMLRLAREFGMDSCVYRDALHEYTDPGVLKNPSYF